MPSPSEELRNLEAGGLLRGLRPLDSPAGPRVSRDGRELWNFASNDYLGLARHPEIENAMVEGVGKFGAGAAASRLVCGTLGQHVELESALAAAKGTEAALAYSSGYAAAAGTLPAIATKGDILIMDKLCHASLIDGARLSGADIRVFPHNNISRLDHLLQWASAQARPQCRVIIVAESIYSMDGDAAPLAEIIALKERHGALLLLDEAHAFGIMGPGGRGLAAQLGMADQVDIHMGTLSKAAGLSGGFICGSRSLIDLLINRARSFIYSTAPPPAIAAAATHVVRNILPGPQGETLRARLRENVTLLSTLTDRPAPPAAIFPIITGTESSAMEAAAALREKGILVPGIRFPTVPRGSARLRITLSAAHQEPDIRALATAIQPYL